MSQPSPAPAPALCPKCSRPRDPRATECPSCGVIFARYHERPRPAAPLPTVLVPPRERPVYLDSRALETLLTTLAQALEAGMPLPSIVNGAVVAYLPARLSQSLRSGVEAGGSFAETLARSLMLDQASLALVQAGERNGRLPEALRQVAACIAERRKDRNRLLLILAYPTCLLVAGILLLPLPTLFSCQGGAGAYFSIVMPPLLGLAALAIVALVVWPRLSPSSTARLGLRRLAASLPIASTLLWSGALARFAEVLGASLRAGLPIQESLSLAGRAASHPRIETALPIVLARIDSGARLAEALATIPGLDPAWLAQLASGEQTGTLDKALPRMAEAQRSRARLATLILVGAVGAIVLMAVGAGLAWEVVSSWRGIFDSRSRSIEQIVGGP